MSKYLNSDNPKNDMPENQSIDRLIVTTTWEEKETDLVVQYKIDKKLNLESVDELTK